MSIDASLVFLLADALRLQLFVYRDLQQWLDRPFRAPPTPVGLRYEQRGLPFVGGPVGQHNRRKGEPGS